MSNSPEVPNLVCDPRENQWKLPSTSTGKNHRELAWRPFHHFSTCGVLFFILCEPHENYAAWTSLTMYDTLKWKQITHVQICILTFGSLFIADNILKGAIVTKVVKRKGCRIEKWNRCRPACTGVAQLLTQLRQWFLYWHAFQILQSACKPIWNRRYMKSPE